MAEINQEVTRGNEALGMVLDAMLVDMTSMRTSLNAAISDLGTVRTAMNVAISKLNADGGVSDTNYAAITTLGATAAGELTVTS